MSGEAHHAEGPVPVRDLMTTTRPEEEGEAAWNGQEQVFEHDGTRWVARSAGAGACGTGRVGLARLVAVHFYRVEEPDRPVAEALAEAGRFPDMWAEELRSLFERATPLEPER